MVDALRFEYIRLITHRLSLVLLVLALIGSAILPTILAFSDSKELTSNRAGALVVGGLGIVPELPPIPAMLIGMAGALSVGGEYAYSSMKQSLLAVPQRMHLLLAKLIVMCSAALVVGTVSIVLNIVIVAIASGPLPLGRQAGVILGYLMLLMLYAALGVGAAFALRHTLGAAGILFGGFIAEQVIRGLAFLPAISEHKEFIKFLPFAAGTSLAQAMGGKLATSVEPLTRIQNGLVFLVFVGGIMTWGILTFLRRDA